jgi:hypothetical protein|tara:strand:- start:647 stop:844 length:198 start_codon:yes stop_codon:yes gene_type:complete
MIHREVIITQNKKERRYESVMMGISQDDWSSKLEMGVDGIADMERGLIEDHGSITRRKIVTSSLP